MNYYFDTVEELTGKYPDSDSLRNAVHAIDTWDLWTTNPRWAFPTGRMAIADWTYGFLANVESIARKYEKKFGGG